MKCKEISMCFAALLLSSLPLNVGERLHEYRRAAFSRAAWLGDTKAMRVLMIAGADVNEPVAAYINPLVAASESGNPDAINLLLDHGAKINQRDEHDYTALIYATGAGQVTSVKVLIARGADVNVVGRHGSALNIAAQTNHPEIAKMLQRAGAQH